MSQQQNGPAAVDLVIDFDPVPVDFWHCSFLAASWPFPEAFRRNLILARSRRLWELHNFAAANAVSAWRGNRPIANSFTAAHNASWQFYSLRSIAFPPDWNAIILARKIGIGPVRRRFPSADFV
jgi:hypothetical protein